MQVKSGISMVEVVMMGVVFAIVAVVALPVIGINGAEMNTSVAHKSKSTEKVKSAYALAIAQKGNFPRLRDVVEYIDADFSAETNDLSGIIFRDGVNRLTVSTFQDTACKIKTNSEKPGITDIVRCI